MERQRRSRVNTKDAFAFPIQYVGCPPKKRERLRVNSLKDALAFTLVIVAPVKDLVNTFCRKNFRIMQKIKVFARNA
jgi:hypothetical protein